MAQPSGIVTRSRPVYSHGREFELSRIQFDEVKALVKSHTGIHLTDHKKELVYGRLARRLRMLGLNDFGRYLAMLKRPGSEELENFVNAITTNLTSFFREPHHFEYLANHFVPELIARDREARCVRIWSAGCSTGEEVYSLAMTLTEALAHHPGWTYRLDASDLDSDVLETASDGVYSASRVEGLSTARLHRFFLRGKGKQAGKVRIRRGFREHISFQQVNLMQQWPYDGPFDAIFCRNVVIYFDKPTQRALFDRFATMLPMGGLLFVGHSESLYRVTDRFRLIGKTIYERIS